MKLYVIRHGHKQKGSYHSDLLRHQDEPLSEQGDIQARSLVDYFEGKDIKKIYASQYTRTQQTAKYIAESRGIPIIIDGRSNEIDNGLIDEMTEEEIEQAYPEMWGAYLSHATDYKYPGGESGEDVRERQNSLLADIAEKNEDALLVCHEGFIRALVCNILGAPVYHRYKLHTDFCGITELQYDPEAKEWSLLKFNHTVC